MKHVPLLLVMLAVLTTVPAIFAQEYTSRRDVFADETLRRDFNVQGEYLYGKDDARIGVQIIADGGGKFRCVAYVKGLPGDGWKRGDAKVHGKAEFAGDDTLKFIWDDKVIDGDENSFPANLKEAEAKFASGMRQGPPNREGGQRGEGQAREGNRERGQRPEGQARGQRGEGQRDPRRPRTTITFGEGDVLTKVIRRSPTLDAKAPEGAYVVFDGTNVDNFHDGAKMNENPMGGNTLWAEAAAKPFEKGKPYTLHLEFMLSYMPQAHGQARSNSGVYIFEAYECQVLDSFGLEGENNECGGFYTIAKPAVNMCFPPLMWQTYDIDFTPPTFEDGKKTVNARLTVKHNGVVIHDDIELPKETPGRKGEADEARGVYLQGHGNKVQYRNIWVAYK